MLVILLSVLLLGDDISGLSALGCALSVVGSAWYGYVCLWAREEAAKAGNKTGVANGR